MANRSSLFLTLGRRWTPWLQPLRSSRRTNPTRDECGTQISENDPGDEEQGKEGVDGLYPPLRGWVALHGDRKRFTGPGQAAWRGAGGGLYQDSPACRSVISAELFDAFSGSYPRSPNKSHAPVQERCDHPRWNKITQRLVTSLNWNAYGTSLFLAHA